MYFVPLVPKEDVVPYFFFDFFQSEQSTSGSRYVGIQINRWVGQGVGSGRSVGRAWVEAEKTEVSIEMTMVMIDCDN